METNSVGYSILLGLIWAVIGYNAIIAVRMHCELKCLKQMTKEASNLVDELSQRKETTTNDRQT